MSNFDDIRDCHISKYNNISNSSDQKSILNCYKNNLKLFLFIILMKAKDVMKVIVILLVVKMIFI